MLGQFISVHLKVQDASSRLAEAIDWRPCLAVRSRHAPASLQGWPNRAESRSRASRFDDSAKMSASAIRRFGYSAAMAIMQAM
jgi:hypothetical protein